MHRDFSTDAANQSARSMLGVNEYHRALSDEEIENGAHRDFVGGMWDEIGRLQFDFLVKEGLRPEHTLIDIGCGALRGGVHFVRYLQPRHYYGLDINPTLIDAGRQEVANAGLAERCPNLLVDNEFRLSHFDRQFDFGVSVSLFTHLYLNHIGRCLAEVRKVMHPASEFYFTFFEAPQPIHLQAQIHNPGGAKTFYDRDPFHYAFEEIETVARRCGIEACLIGEWNHPRDQRMMRLQVAKS